MRRFLTLALLTCVAVAAQAQDRLQLYVAAAPKDQVGTRLAFQLREQVRMSRAMALAQSPQAAQMQIYLATLDPQDNGQQTIYSATITIRDNNAITGDAFWSQTIGSCPKANTLGCAQSLVALVDQSHQEYLAELRKMRAAQPTK